MVITKARILIVDDDHQMLEALRLTLQSSGYSITPVDNGKDALSIFQKDEFDILITDMKMPEMNGIELIKKIVSLDVPVTIIMITAFGSIETAVEAMKLGALDFIEKPFSDDKLLDTVEKAMSKIRSSEHEKNQKMTYGFSKEIIYGSSNMSNLMNLVDKIAHSDISVLITGESGTGKELVARFIHQKSKRKDEQFVAINCAALPEGLLESELFGHEKGAFTGAINRKMGKFLLADKGTLLLDEISELHPSLQAKLLRALQEGEIDVVGGKSPIRIDVRVIATTNRDLKACVKKGAFRQDLFFRLNVFPVHILPLRERLDDIPLLIKYFSRKYNPLRDWEEIFSKEAIDYLAEYQWPGNVRELENVIQRAILLSKDKKLKPEEIYLDRWDEQPDSDIGSKIGGSMDQMEKSLIIKTLEQSKGNKTLAAEILGISVRTLRNKLNQYKKDL
jgi:DNA-binding NtrC family response regulator